MTDPAPSQFYTGLVADLYAPFRSADPDPEPYARFIRSFGEPALELGCGTGDPLLDLRARGLEVDGLDASTDMLEHCRRRAAERDLHVQLFTSTIEAMDLGRRYRSIFLAGATYNLLPDDDTARRGLERIRAHLTDDGAALIPLFVPDQVPSAEIGRVREQHDDASGETRRFSIVASARDVEARVQRNLLRYERVTATGTQIIERTWLLHWHTQRGFRDLAEGAGLTVAAMLNADGTPADEAATSYTFLLTPR